MRTQVLGARTQDNPEFEIQDPGPRTQDLGPSNRDSGRGTQDPGPGTQDPFSDNSEHNILRILVNLPNFLLTIIEMKRDY